MVASRVDACGDAGGSGETASSDWVALLSLEVLSCASLELRGG